MMNLGEMETALKRFGFDTADPLAVWLNAAMHDLEDSFDWPWLESKVITENMPAKSATITLPENCLKILSIKDLTNQRKLKYWNRHKFIRDIQEPEELGLAEVYTLINTNEIQLWRVPEVEVQWEIWYQTTTPDLVNPEEKPKSGENVWPSATGFIIVMKAAALALQAENEEERAKVCLEQYKDMRETLMRKYGQRQLDEPETVIDAMNYTSETGRGFWF